MLPEEERRRLRMLGYWSVSQRNILGIPNRDVEDDDDDVLDGEMIGEHCV